MATQWSFFYCPQCAARYEKTDARFSTGKVPAEANLIEGGVFGVFSTHAACPGCAQQIELAGIVEGRYDSPRLTPKDVLRWAVVAVVTLAVLRVVLVAAGQH